MNDNFEEKSGFIWNDSPVAEREYKLKPTERSSTGGLLRSGVVFNDPKYLKPYLHKLLNSIEYNKSISNLLSMLYIFGVFCKFFVVYCVVYKIDCICKKYVLEYNIQQVASSSKQKLTDSQLLPLEECHVHQVIFSLRNLNFDDNDVKFLMFWGHNCTDEYIKKKKKYCYFRVIATDCDWNHKLFNFRLDKYLKEDSMPEINTIHFQDAIYNFYEQPMHKFLYRDINDISEMDVLFKLSLLLIDSELLYHVLPTYTTIGITYFFVWVVCVVCQLFGLSNHFFFFFFLTACLGCCVVCIGAMWTSFTDMFTLKTNETKGGPLETTGGPNETVLGDQHYSNPKFGILQQLSNKNSKQNVLEKYTNNIDDDDDESFDGKQVLSDFDGKRKCEENGPLLCNILNLNYGSLEDIIHKEKIRRLTEATEDLYCRSESAFASAEEHSVIDDDDDDVIDDDDDVMVQTSGSKKKARSGFVIRIKRKENDEPPHKKRKANDGSEKY